MCHSLGLIWISIETFGALL